MRATRQLLVVLLADLRLSPGVISVASLQWRKLSSGMSQVALVLSRVAVVIDVVSVAIRPFLWEGVAAPLPDPMLQIRKLADCFCQDFYSRPLWYG